MVHDGVMIDSLRRDFQEHLQARGYVPVESNETSVDGILKIIHRFVPSLGLFCIGKDTDGT